MAIEILKEIDPKKVEAWDRLHDKRKLYRCERCGAEWKCEYHENKFGSKHEINGDPDILCQCCGYPTVKEVDNTLTVGEKAEEYIGPFDEVKYFCCGIDAYMLSGVYTTKGSLWFEDKPAGELTAINDSVTEYNVIRLVFALETEFNWLHAHKLGEFNFKIEFNKEYDEIQLRLWRKE